MRWYFWIRHWFTIWRPKTLWGCWWFLMLIRDNVRQLMKKTDCSKMLALSYLHFRIILLHYYYCFTHVHVHTNSSICYFLFIRIIILLNISEIIMHIYCNCTNTEFQNLVSANIYITAINQDLWLDKDQCILEIQQKESQMNNFLCLQSFDKLLSAHPNTRGKYPVMYRSIKWRDGDESNRSFVTRFE